MKGHQMSSKRDATSTTYALMCPRPQPITEDAFNNSRTNLQHFEPVQQIIGAPSE